MRIVRENLTSTFVVKKTHLKTHLNTAPFGNYYSLTPGSVSSKKLALMEQDPGKRMGNWEKLVHPVARRQYFVNKDTGQASWNTPAEV